MGTETKAPSSSSDSSSSHPSALFSTALSKDREEDKITELRLGLNISNSTSLQKNFHTAREHQPANWPPIKHFMSTAMKERKKCQKNSTFFIKVYMEGIPIGRKIDLYTVDGYSGLREKISNMFAALILSSDLVGIISEKHYVLTYEDNEGDWMMVGDVPWDDFLITVKRLKVASAEKC
ncbi:hypothetical protein KFK09_011503 [Dendrobium nobile]|uniref:Auxin-responsive protein n=1 Tax=Dendrobium nobile TaxID=94219 RepID=A0A8T3BCV3_DENNO|nr:hypothetical protein KFK09_011503 [Dendrobium nobile]